MALISFFSLSVFFQVCGHSWYEGSGPGVGGPARAACLVLAYCRLVSARRCLAMPIPVLPAPGPQMHHTATASVAHLADVCCFHRCRRLCARHWSELTVQQGPVKSGEQGARLLHMHVCGVLGGSTNSTTPPPTGTCSLQ